MRFRCCLEVFSISQIDNRQNILAENRKTRIQDRNSVSHSVQISISLDSFISVSSSRWYKRTWIISGVTVCHNGNKLFVWPFFMWIWKFCGMFEFFYIWLLALDFEAWRTVRSTIRSVTRNSLVRESPSTAWSERWNAGAVSTISIMLIFESSQGTSSSSYSMEMTTWGSWSYRMPWRYYVITVVRGFRGWIKSLLTFVFVICKKSKIRNHEVRPATSEVVTQILNWYRCCYLSRYWHHRIAESPVAVTQVVQCNTIQGSIYRSSSLLQYR